MARQGREIITLQCSECKRRNYSTTKNKKTMTEKLELKKFCRHDRKHTLHRETKWCHPTLSESEGEGTVWAGGALVELAAHTDPSLTLRLTTKGN